MIQKKLDELEALITVPNVDKYPEQSLNAMKALNLIVELRGLVKNLDLHIVNNRFIQLIDRLQARSEAKYPQRVWSVGFRQSAEKLWAGREKDLEARVLELEKEWAENGC